jgi:hypothetical protein
MRKITGEVGLLALSVLLQEWLPLSAIHHYTSSQRRLPHKYFRPDELFDLTCLSRYYEIYRVKTNKWHVVSVQCPGM